MRRAIDRMARFAVTLGLLVVPGAVGAQARVDSLAVAVAKFEAALEGRAGAVAAVDAARTFVAAGRADDPRLAAMAVWLADRGGTPEWPGDSLRAWVAAMPHVQRFERFSGRHRRELRDLIVTRGMSGAPSDSAGFSDVIGFVQRAAGRSVLFYAIEDGSLHTWVVNRLGIAAHHEAPYDREALTHRIAAYRGSLGISGAQAARGLGVNPAAGRPDPRRAHDELLETLLPAPVRAALGGTRALFVVPVGDVGTVPFAVLRPFGASHLVDSTAITLVPSLMDLVRRASDSDAARGPAVIVGNPPHDAMPPLPGAEAEARHVAELVRAAGGRAPRLHLGAEATESRVALAAAGASLIYLAAHGIADASNALDESYIALAGGDRWTAREIQHADLRARLVVLSACQTGMGTRHDAGIIGLGRAFQLAGALHVAMTLWNVDDLATRDLMSEFMGRYTADEAVHPAEALRQAMLVLRTRYPDPARWGAFVMFGG